MRVPISWLKEYVDIVLPIEELTERLTLAGMEIDAVTQSAIGGIRRPWWWGKWWLCCPIPTLIAWCWSMWIMVARGTTCGDWRTQPLYI